MPTLGRRVLIADGDRELRDRLRRELVERDCDVTATAKQWVADRLAPLVDVAVIGDSFLGGAVGHARSDALGSDGDRHGGPALVALVHETGQAGDAARHDHRCDAQVSRGASAREIADAVERVLDRSPGRASGR